MFKTIYERTKAFSLEQQNKGVVLTSESTDTEENTISHILIVIYKVIKRVSRALIKQNFCKCVRMCHKVKNKVKKIVQVGQASILNSENIATVVAVHPFRTVCSSSAAICINYVKVPVFLLVFWILSIKKQ